MELSKNSLKLLNISIFSIFIAVLFKPGEKSQGMYEWLIRPEYIITILKIIFSISILVFILSSLVFIIKNLKNIIFYNNYLYIFSSFLFAILFINITDFMFDGQSIVSTIIKILLFILYTLIFNFYSQLPNKTINFLLPISITGGFFVIFNMIILIIDPDAVWPNVAFSRMYGITEHPNFFALICAITFISNFEIIKNFHELCINKNVKIIHKYFLLIISLSILGIVFSGSRTSFLFIIIYFLLSFFKTYRITYIKLVFGLISIVLLFTFLSNLDAFLNIDGYRITSTENNRSEAWNGMINTFIQNPLLGVGLHNVKFSENSYLRVLAGSGIIGFFFYILFIAIVFFKTLLKLKSRNLSIFSYILIPLIITANIEGFLTDVLTFPIITFLYTVSCIYNIQETNNEKNF